MAFRLNPTNQYCYAYSQPGYIPFPVFRYSGSDFGTRCRSTHGASGLPVAISVVPSGKNNLALTYTLGQVPGGTLLQVALVDPMVDNKVPRGENSGRHLEHVQVVRSFQTIKSPKKSGTVELDLNALDFPGQGQVVVFLQDAETWHVLGVTSLVLGGL